MPNNPNAVDNLKPFKKGQSGNPEGKPKGTIHLATHIQNLLNDENFNFEKLDKNGNPFTGAPIKAIITVAIKKAVDGDSHAMEWLAKHGYGTKITLETEDPIERLLKEYGLRGGEDDEQPSEEV